MAIIIIMSKWQLIVVILIMCGNGNNVMCGNIMAINV
jgi:hypothetical protein